MLVHMYLFVFIPKATKGEEDVLEVTSEKACDCQCKDDSGANQKPSPGAICGPHRARQN